jgi:anti-repressor protein
MTDHQNALKVFDFEGRKVRVIMADGEPEWVVNDICSILEISNASDAISRLEKDEVGLTDVIDSLGRRQKTSTVKEAGLYSLILGSRKPEAKIFKRWLTHEVIPAIRKFGGYLTGRKIEEILTDPDTIIHLARNIKAEKEKCRALEAKIDKDRPKVIFAESVEASSSSILVGDLAKLIRQNGVEIGPRRLFEWMRQNGYLLKIGESRNMPTQKSLESGLFEVKERAIDNPDGTILLTRTTKVTGRGQLLFINLFRNIPTV